MAAFARQTITTQGQAQPQQAANVFAAPPSAKPARVGMATPKMFSGGRGTPYASNPRAALATASAAQPSARQSRDKQAAPAMTDWTPSADDYNPTTGAWKRPANLVNATPWDPSTWRPPSSAGSLTVAEHQAFQKANPVGSQGWNDVYNSDFAKRQRSIQSGKMGESDAVYGALMDYANARGLDIMRPGQKQLGRDQSVLSRAQGSLKGLSDEDKIRRLREAVSSINADNAVADQNMERALREKMLFDDTQREYAQEATRREAAAVQAHKDKDFVLATKLRNENAEFMRKNNVGGIRVSNPRSTEEVEEIVRRTVADNRNTLRDQRNNSWGNALYSNAQLGAMRTGLNAPSNWR